MQKFKSLHFTYERLKTETEMLTKRTIELNSEFNLLNEKVKTKEGQLKELEIILKEKTHNNKVDITNFNKDFVEQIEKKNKELKDLQHLLILKENELKESHITQQKTEIRLQVFQEDLKLLERKLNSKTVILNKKEDELCNKSEELKEDKLKWNKKLKEKNLEYEKLEKNIKELRDESIVINQIHRQELEKIEKQKMILEKENVRLSEKEIKINSDMRELLSAKKHNNG